MKPIENKIYGELSKLKLGMQLAINHGAICRIGHDSKGYYLERIGVCKDIHFMNYLKKKIEDKLDAVD
jgi:hypothetical protein